MKISRRFLLRLFQRQDFLKIHGEISRKIFPRQDFLEDFREDFSLAEDSPEDFSRARFFEDSPGDFLFAEDSGGDFLEIGDVLAGAAAGPVCK